MKINRKAIESTVAAVFARTMRINRKIIESAAVAVFALAIVITGAIAENAGAKAKLDIQEVAAEESEELMATKARTMIDIVAATDMALEEAIPVLGAATDGTETAEAGPAAETEASPWADRLMPNVEQYLNIRAEAGTEAEVVGKLYKGAAADILERGEEWTRIHSGSVEGYVKNEFCVFGAEAEALANQLGTVYATSLTGGLRVRAEASTEESSAVLDVLEEGKKIKVAVGTEAPEGWVAVICSDRTAYVSAQYVSVELELGKAISIEEEKAALKKAEEERKAAEAKKKQKAARTQKAAIASSYDDLTLLGALIQCEAGGESYEGQVAVGAVVMNRIRSGYAGTISGVIFQSGQFTPASSGALERRLAKGVSSSCLAAAQEAINGVDNVSGATHFCRVRSGLSGIVIGHHVFY